MPYIAPSIVPASPRPLSLSLSPSTSPATEYTLYLAVNPQPEPHSATWLLILRPLPHSASSCTWYSSFGGPAQDNTPYHHRLEIKRDFPPCSFSSSSSSSSISIPSHPNPPPPTPLGTIHHTDLHTFEHACFYSVPATQSQVFAAKVLYMLALKGLLEVHVVASVWERVEIADADVAFDERFGRRYSRQDRAFFATFQARTVSEAGEGVKALRVFWEGLRSDAERVLRELWESFGVEWGAEGDDEEEGNNEEERA